jgi:hypothetical protein
MVISDFNHDGKLDVAVSNTPLEAGGNIAILSGNGAGSFTLAMTLPKCAFLRGADFNRDGNMDLLGVTTSPLSLYLGNSQGGFSAPITVGNDLPASVPSFTIDDFNHDQIPDVAALYGTGTRHVVILRGNGNGTFTTGNFYQVAVMNGAHLATGDLNADGEVDIAGTNPDNTMGQGFVLWGTGTGTFSGRVNYTVNGLSPSQLAVADFNGDGRADIVTDLNNRTAVSVVLSTCLNPTPRYDFDADGKSDIAVYRPSSGIWYALRTSDGSLLSVHWGVSTDRIVPGDYDGDSRTDVAVYRPSIGAWFVLRSSNFTVKAQSWGVASDQPVPADFDGDGRTDLAVYRAGAWYILKSSDDSIVAENFGLASDKPVPADFDGDGKADLAVFRPSDGTWYIHQSLNGFFRSEPFGTNGDIPVAGDYDGDGIADVAVYRPQSRTWYARTSQFYSLWTKNWGVATDTPVPADYDGDGKTDYAVYRPTDGTWYILKSADNSFLAQPFGLSSDVPLSSASLTP